MRVPQARKRTIQIRQPKQRWVSWLVYGIAIALFLGACTAPLWFGRTVRRLIPPRYIAAYAPEILQEIIYSDINAQVSVPTPVGGSASESTSLLGESSTPTPVIAGLGNDGSSTPEQNVTVPTATLQPTSVPTASIPADFLLTGFKYTPQGYNNCGPATLTTVLSYWGVQVTQDETAGALKGSDDDGNVNPGEIAAYVESLGLHAVVRIEGDIDLLKRFIAAGYPVVIERGFDEEPEKRWMGHYMLIVGYSNQASQFAALDVYWGWKHHGLGAEFPVDYWDYDRLDELWRHFNRTYYVVYPYENASEVASIIGPEIDDQIMYTNAAERAREELRQNGSDLWGWFNLGSSLNGLEDYQNAAIAFDQARIEQYDNSIGLPRRMLWYQFGPYEAYLHTGRYDDVIELAVWTLEWSSSPESQSEEAWYYRGLAVLAQGNKDDARTFFTWAWEHNKHFQAAKQALEQLDSGG